MKEGLRTYWWKTPKQIIKNFGDELNPYLIEKITGKKPTYGKPSEEYDTVLGIGSVLGLLMDRLHYCIVWGSGFGRKVSRLKNIIKGKKLTPPKKICAVRGPLTRKCFLDFKIPCPEVYGDPALLLPRYFKPDVKTKYEWGIIPHYMDYNHPWIEENRKKGYFIINVNEPVEKVITDILSCNNIISRGLHGLIVADAYGIPSVWIILSNFLKRQTFKFQDYFASLGYYNQQPVKIKNSNFPIEYVKQKKTLRKVNIDLDLLLEVCPYL